MGSIGPEAVNRLIAEAAPAKVEITRGIRGGYGWSISLRGDDEAEVVRRILDVDYRLRSVLSVESGETGATQDDNGAEAD